MHKKRIKGKTYFYTSYRDKNGKINTKYLGSDERLARKAEAEFKGLPQTRYWQPFLITILVLAGILFLQNYDNINVRVFSMTGASTIKDYGISAYPSVEEVGIYNSTAHFNLSLFGYGNYSDPDFDDSNGTSTYNWYVNEVLNQTGTTGQLLLCHFNNNYTCEEEETANITQYHTEFNTTEEIVNVTLSEENSTLVYISIPRMSTVTEAFMSISGYLTSAYNLLSYDAILNANYRNPGTSQSSKHYMAGVIQSVGDGAGIDSWFLITNTTNLSTSQTANILSIKYGNTFGTPSNGNFTYNIKICPTSLTSLSRHTHTTEPDGNCTSPYVLVTDPVNLSSNFIDSSGWQNFTFYDNVSIRLDGGTNHILKFEFVEGDLSITRYWEMYLVDDETNPAGVPSYVAYNNTGEYNSMQGNQYVQFYSKSNYPKGVEIDVGNDNTINFADDNESFDTTNTTADFTSDIITFLSTCSDNYCDVPVNISSNSSGVIGLEALFISYDHYDLAGKFSEGMIANYSFTTSYPSDNNIHNHNGTLDMWIKPYWAGNDNTEYTLFTDSGNIIQLNKSTGNELIFFVDGATVSCSTSSWSARDWHLVTATWNQGEKLYLYTDGAGCGSANAPSTISGLGELIFIGSNAENTTQANSTIDELRITSFPRTPDEINTYYSESRQFFQNEVFLNSTDTQIKRDDNVTFELIPKDATGATGDAGISEVIISNFIPIEPTLNIPANDTYFSLQEAFSWFNGTDYDKEDTVYYILQIGEDAFTDPVTFTEPVAYYNGGIVESTDPTSHLVTGVSDGNYSWRVASTDPTGNSSFTDPRVVSLDSTAPNLTLTDPSYRFAEVSSTTADQEIILHFNVSESNPLENCTLNLNDTDVPSVNQTLTHINQTENNFTVTLAFGGYNWTINCTDIANNINTTGDTAFSFVKYDNFKEQGRTTNFSALENPENVTDLVIENPEYGVINFSGAELDLRGGLDLDSYVSISQNRIVINGAGVPSLNTSANLTIFNLTLTDNYVQKDGLNCTTECTVIDSTPATYTFSITGAGTYTTSRIPQPPAIITPTGGSGGGGGTKTLTKRKNFDFQTGLGTNIITLQMTSNGISFQKLGITNTGDLTFIVSITHNLGGLLEISPEQFKLDPGKTKTVSTNFYAKETGIHTGQILITVDELQKIIPVILEVRSEKILVDAKLEVFPEYAELKRGDALKAQITLFNTAKKKIPVVITYLIKDLEGNIVAEETETFDIIDEKSFVKTFDTSNLKSGSYVTGMNVRYLDSFATSSARFEVKAEPVKKPVIEFKWWYMIVIISLFILIMLLKIRSADFGNMLRRKKTELKKYEK